MTTSFHEILLVRYKYMKTPQTLICLLFIGISNICFAQDNRIQNPKKNFDKLWETTRDEYCNFDQVDIDWNERYQHYSQQVTDSTTNDELFAICGNLLKELNDMHVVLDRNSKYQLNFIESGKPSKFFTEFPDSARAFRLLTVNDSILYSRGFSEFTILKPNIANVGVMEYCFSDSLAYLVVNSMEGISNYKLNKAMHQIVDSLQTRKGLIIDIRLNGGGYDKKGYSIAKYLTAEDKISVFKHTRKKGKDEYSKLKKVVVKANTKHNYTGKVILLTSDYSVSAADVFALTLSNFDHVTLVGDRTAGFFSDVYAHKLPNGWKYTLSTQKYYSEEMVNYERKGVPPDYHILNTYEASKKGKDPVLEKALELLR